MESEPNPDEDYDSDYHEINTNLSDIVDENVQRNYNLSSRIQVW